MAERSPFRFQYSGNGTLWVDHVCPSPLVSPGAIPSSQCPSLYYAYPASVWCLTVPGDEGDVTVDVAYCPFCGVRLAAFDRAAARGGAGREGRRRPRSSAGPGGRPGGRGPPVRNLPAVVVGSRRLGDQERAIELTRMGGALFAEHPCGKAPPYGDRAEEGPRSRPLWSPYHDAWQLDHVRPPGQRGGAGDALPVLRAPPGGLDGRGLRAGGARR